MKKEDRKKGYFPKTWYTIGKFRICIINSKEYKVQRLGSPFAYNLLCKDVNKVIKEMENDTYFLPWR